MFGYPFGFRLGLFGFQVFGVRDLSYILVFINLYSGIYKFRSGFRLDHCGSVPI